MVDIASHMTWISAKNDAVVRSLPLKEVVCLVPTFSSSG